MTTKRHAKPTAAALAARTYRKVLRLEQFTGSISLRIGTIEGTISTLMRHAQARIDAANKLDAHMSVLLDHCSRLLREKETLAKLLDAERAIKASRPLEEAMWSHTWGHIVPDGRTPPEIAAAEKAQELEERRAYANLMRGVNPHSHAMRAVPTVTDTVPSRKCICGWAEGKRLVHADSCPCR